MQYGLTSRFAHGFQSHSHDKVVNRDRETRQEIGRTESGGDCAAVGVGGSGASGVILSELEDLIYMPKPASKYRTTGLIFISLYLPSTTTMITLSIARVGS